MPEDAPPGTAEKSLDIARNEMENIHGKTMPGRLVDTEVTPQGPVIPDHFRPEQEIGIVIHIPLVDHLAPQRHILHVLYPRTGNAVDIVMAAVPENGLDCRRIAGLDDAHEVIARIPDPHQLPELRKILKPGRIINKSAVRKTGGAPPDIFHEVDVQRIVIVQISGKDSIRSDALADQRPENVAEITPVDGLDEDRLELRAQRPIPGYPLLVFVGSHAVEQHYPDKILAGLMGNGREAILLKYPETMLQPTVGPDSIPGLVLMPDPDIEPRKYKMLNIQRLRLFLALPFQESPPLREKHLAHLPEISGHQHQGVRIDAVLPARTDNLAIDEPHGLHASRIDLPARPHGQEIDGHVLRRQTAGVKEAHHQLDVRRYLIILVIKPILVEVLTISEERRMRREPAPAYLPQPEAASVLIPDRITEIGGAHIADVAVNDLDIPVPGKCRIYQSDDIRPMVKIVRIDDAHDVSRGHPDALIHGLVHPPVGF